jgi:hypothetical protein
MGWQIIKQPDSKLAIFSSVTGNWIATNCIADEVEELFAEEMGAASTWIRDVLLAAAGWHDTTRRTARRRPNQQPRTAAPGRLYTSVSPREKAIRFMTPMVLTHTVTTCLCVSAVTTHTIKHTSEQDFTVELIVTKRNEK